MPKAPSDIARFGWLGLGLLACLVVLLTEPDSPLQVGIYSLTVVASAVVFALAVQVMPPAARPVWRVLLAAQVLYVVGDLYYNVQTYSWQEEAFPGWADLFYLSFSAAQALALVLLVRRRYPGHDREAWIDTAIMSIGVISAVGAFVVVPLLAGSEEAAWATTVSVAYPVLDVVVLCALVRVLIGGGGRSAALGLLVLGQLSMLAADLGFTLLTVTGAVTNEPAWVQAMFLTSTVLLAAAATVPSARTLAVPVRTGAAPMNGVRMAGLVAGALTAPVLLVVVTWESASVEVRVLAVASVAVTALVLWRVILLVRTIQAQAVRLAEQARTDGLTGLPNRRTWDFQLDRSAAAALAQRSALTVAMLDLDHFKAYNDVHGHPGGDHLLVQCATAWRAQLPADALLARYGGEEFAVLLPAVDLAAAQWLMDDLRRATPGGQTVSIGVAQWDGTETVGHTVDRADRALYAAKSTGRDRVVAHDGTRTMLRGRSEAVRPRPRDLSGVFQPVVALATGDPVSYEVQARLPGLLPDETLAAAWRAGFGPGLEAAALAYALDDYRDGFPIHVAISAHALADPSVAATLPDDLSGVLVTVGPQDGGGVPTLDAVVLAPLRRRGARVALLLAEDTGVDGWGWHGPAPDLVTLPPGLVSMVTVDPLVASRAAELVTRCQEQGAQVCALGVRTMEQRDLLLGLGVAYAQGPLFARGVAPLPA